MSIEELSGGSCLQEFLHLAPKSVRPLLMLAKGELGDIDFGDTSYCPVAWGSRDSAGTPNGLLVAEIWPESDPKPDYPLAKAVDIRSLFVARHSRNQGVAKSLIGALCSSCSRWPGTAINIVFPKDQPSSLFLEKLTDQSEGWRPNKSIYYVTIEDCLSLYGFYKRCDFVGKRKGSKYGFFIEPLTKNTLDEVQLMAEKSSLDAWAMPSSIEEEILFDYSRSLRVGGELIGWLLCTGERPDYLFYRSGWVFPYWQDKGCLPALIASICGQAHFQSFDQNLDCNSMKPFERACFEFDSINLPMVRFSEKNLVPIASSVICTVDKELILL